MSAPEAAVAPSAPEVDEVTRSLAPSHILQDGRFVHLPPPTDRERRHFFERSVARHGLLEEDLGDKKAPIEEEEDKKKKEEAKVHPLALASARLQADGINELNRAINLSSLVATGEYFGMSNIVDPSLEIPSATKDTKGTSGESTPAPAAEKSESALELAEEQRVKASFILKRKRAQFRKAQTVLGRHQKRLAAAIVAQSRPDERLRQLRPQWRLVAAEHGSRALPHAARPTEVVAVDVDVYLKSGAVLGRLASRVPRYATMELKSDYKLDNDLKVWREEYLEEKDESAMDVDSVDDQEESQSDKSGVEKEESDSKKPADEAIATMAEPFAIADPTLGKLDADFDPKKVPMLSLQFDIEKGSTGFRQSAVLKPLSSESSSVSYQEDEKVLFSLQHSLFCAKLFESIRRELAPDTEEIGNVRTTAKAQSVVWLAGESETNFLPAPALMSGSRTSGLSQLCVTHCHEGEVKVQLDCEYKLRVKLVEANDAAKLDATFDQPSTADSGSETPRQLLTICRILLLHAQERYHCHSVEAAEIVRQEEQEESKQPHMLKRKASAVESPRILQSCVGLGSKLLFERRIRRVLGRTKQWLSRHSSETLDIQWLSLSVFDSQSLFTITFRSLTLNAEISGEEIVVTSMNEHGDYRKTKFHSDDEFCLYLQLTLERLLAKGGN